MSFPVVQLPWSSPLITFFVIAHKYYVNGNKLQLSSRCYLFVPLMLFISNMSDFIIAAADSVTFFTCYQCKDHNWLFRNVDDKTTHGIRRRINLVSPLTAKPLNKTCLLVTLVKFACVMIAAVHFQTNLVLLEVQKWYGTFSPAGTKHSVQLL